MKSRSMVVLGNDIEWRQPIQWTKLVWVLLKKSKRFRIKFGDLPPPARHSPFWRQMVNQSVLYQTNETLRGISILRRWTTDFNRNPKPVFHPTNGREGKTRTLFGLPACAVCCLTSDTVLDVKRFSPNSGQTVFRFSTLQRRDESVFALPPR